MVMHKKSARLTLILLSTVLLVSGSAYTLMRPAGKDRNPPTVMLSIPAPTGNNGWYNKPLSVYVYAWDGGKGVKDVEVSLGGGTWYKRTLTIRKDGTYKVIGKASDKAGNVATTWQIVHVDMTPPTVDFVVPQAQGITNNWYVKPVTLTLSGEDNLSGVYQTNLTANGSLDSLQTGLLDAVRWSSRKKAVRTLSWEIS
jgi:hypothetical protein